MTREGMAQGSSRARRWSWLDAVAWLGVVGAAVRVYTIRFAWASIQVATTQPGQSTSMMSWAPVRAPDAIYAFLFARFGTRGFPLASDVLFLWLVTLASGVVLALAMAVWRKSRLAATAYGVWLVVVTLGFALIGFIVFGPPPQALCEVNCDYVVIFARTPASGLWLNSGALALVWIGGGARLATLRGTASAERRRMSLTGALRSLLSRARIGALAFTAGVAVWFFGYIFTPWATQGCTGFPVNWSHFVSGSCAGLDSDEVLVYATTSGFANGSYLGFWVIGVLLAMLVALIAIWQRGWIPPLISLLWAAFATWLTALAISGFPGMFQNPQHFQYSTAPWVVGYGPFVSVAGLVIAWAGIAALSWKWLVDWRANPRRLPQSKSARVSRSSRSR